jgi:hypothetical protein
MSAKDLGNSAAPLDEDGGTVVRLSRRNLLRRSLRVVPPAVVTLASAPVSAGICLNASGFVSAPTFASRHPGMGENCAGQSPAAWADDNAVWPSKFVNQNGKTRDLSKGDLKGNGSGTKFNAVFTKDLTSKPSLRVALNGYSPVATMHTVAAAVVALWLNAMTGKTGGVFTAADAKVIWENIAANGGYKPNPSGPTWTLQQTQDWLALTWGQPLPAP